jgi:hypothetical protein
MTRFKQAGLATLGHTSRYFVKVGDRGTKVVRSRLPQGGLARLGVAVGSIFPPLPHQERRGEQKTGLRTREWPSEVALGWRGSLPCAGYFPDPVAKEWVCIDIRERCGAQLCPVRIAQAGHLHRSNHCSRQRLARLRLGVRLGPSLPRLTLMTGRMDRRRAILADVPPWRRSRRGTPKTCHSAAVPHLHTPILVHSSSSTEPRQSEGDHHDPGR